MNLALWIVQAVLALIFLGAGTLKLVQSRDRLVKTLGGWVEDVPAGLIKAIGALEILAAIGLILPPALGIFPVLAPLAAAGLVAVMVGAIITHARRGEYFKRCRQRRARCHGDLCGMGPVRAAPVLTGDLLHSEIRRDTHDSTSCLPGTTHEGLPSENGAQRGDRPDRAATR